MWPSDRKTSLNSKPVVGPSLSGSGSSTGSGPQCEQVEASGWSSRPRSSASSQISYSSSLRLRNTSGRPLQRPSRCCCGLSSTEARPLGVAGGLEMSLPRASASASASASDVERGSSTLSTLRERDCAGDCARERARHLSNSFTAASASADASVAAIREVLLRYRSFRSRESLRRTHYT